MWNRIIAAAVAAVAWAAAPGSASGAPAVRLAVLPIPGAVTRGYDAPEPDWKPGHRGVDLAGEPGQQVGAAAAGVVTFVGSVAGVPVVVVSHGDVRTTYGPVTATVREGDQVQPGTGLGALVAGHPGCPAPACLHWGLKRGERYLNPLSLLQQREVRLVPSASPTPAATPAGGGPLRRPPGPITSVFGMRVHPVTGEYVLHDGTDFGLGCGTPLGAAGGGTVIRASAYGGYGNTVEIDHGMIDGHRVTTLYGHLSAISVPLGASIQAGDVIGLVGTTGWSTGCHLHFGVYRDGVPIDPVPVTS